MAGTPSGWYVDPREPGRLRYWDGVEWSTYVAVQTHRRNWVPLGIVSLVIALAVAGVSFVLAVLSSNACGMFADGCDDYGEPADGFWFFVTMLVVSLVIALVAVVGTVIAAATRSRGRKNEPDWRVLSSPPQR